MLIFTRKAGQGIVIDHAKTIRILRIDGDLVEIEVEGGTGVPLWREELQPEQEIVIDLVTTICILRIKGNRVKIGIDAPTSIRVDREEMMESRTASPP